MNADEVRSVLKVLLGKKNQESSLLEDILPHAAAAGGTFAMGEFVARKASPAVDTSVLPGAEKAALYGGMSADVPDPASNYLSWQKTEALEKRLYDADAAAGRGALRRVLARKGIQ